MKGIDSLDDGRPLQDRLPGHCFGCGTLNGHGLRIKSRWEGDELVCWWRARAEHVGYPGLVHGGTIASVVDCHAVWASLSAWCRDAGHDLDAGAPSFAAVTASLQIDYLRSARMDQALELRARLRDHGLRKSLVDCRVLQGPMECARAEVLMVRVKALP